MWPISGPEALSDFGFWEAGLSMSSPAGHLLATLAQPRGPLGPTWGAATSYVVPDWTLLPRPVRAWVCTILGCHLPPAPGGSLLPLLGAFQTSRLLSE